MCREKLALSLTNITEVVTLPFGLACYTQPSAETKDTVPLC